MKYFCIENQENDKHSILGLAISFQIFMQDATLCIMCSDKTYEYIKNFYDFTFNIRNKQGAVWPSHTNGDYKTNTQPPTL